MRRLSADGVVDRAVRVMECSDQALLAVLSEAGVRQPLSRAAEMREDARMLLAVAHRAKPGRMVRVPDWFDDVAVSGEGDCEEPSDGDCEDAVEPGEQDAKALLLRGRERLNALAWAIPKTGSADGPPPEFDQVHAVFDALAERLGEANR